MRKAFHLLGIAVPLSYWWLREDLFFLFFYLLMALIFVLEIARLMLPVVSGLYIRFFGIMLRPREFYRPSGAFFYAIGASLTIFLFPRDIAIAALLVLAVADPVAAFIGLKYGRRRLFGKTLEGSMTFFLSAWLLLILFFGDGPYKHLLPAFMGALAELLPLPWNDNLTIPLAIGLTYYFIL